MRRLLPCLLALWPLPGCGLGAPGAGAAATAAVLQAEAPAAAPAVVAPAGGPYADDAGICPPKSGNSLGVGTRCTKGGGQCDTLVAQFCSADYTALPLWFCTRLCDATIDCGSGASCNADPQNPNVFVCLPDACNILPPATTIPPLSACLPAPPGPLGIGRPCTAGGNECAGNKAKLCTVDALPGAPFSCCTLVCQADGDCDPGSRCIPAPGGLGITICIPSACLP